jgi:AraC-like DNA-binding protein
MITRQPGSQERQVPTARVRKQRPAVPVTQGEALVRRGTVRMAPIMLMPALLREKGVDPVPLLAEFWLRPADFAEPENTISVATRVRLLSRCAEVAQCPHFGLLLGQRAGISVFGAVGLLVQSATDVRSALQTAARYYRFHNPNAAAELVEHDSFASLSFTTLDPAAAGDEQLVDYAVAAMFNVMRSLCGHHWKPAEVHLARPRPRNVGPYRDFFHVPLVFDAAETSLVFAAHWLDQPLVSADPLLRLMMQHRIDELEVQSKETLAGRLRRVLPSLITTQGATLGTAAERLGLGPRTLNRRLAAEGTSFLRLRDEARYAIARHLLRGTRMPANLIADRLGYANASAFTSAFRRWSGVGPAKWRAAASCPHGRRRRRAR